MPSTIPPEVNVLGNDLLSVLNDKQADRLRRLLRTAYNRDPDGFSALLSTKKGAGVFGRHDLARLVESGILANKTSNRFLGNVLEWAGGGDPNRNRPPKPPGGGGEGGGGGGGFDGDWLNAIAGRLLGNFVIPMPNPNSWERYTPMSGKAQEWMPWQPAGGGQWSLDPMQQGAAPTFWNQGPVLDPVDLKNKNLPPWPNFPVYDNPYPAWEGVFGNRGWGGKDGPGQDERGPDGDGRPAEGEGSDPVGGSGSSSEPPRETGPMDYSGGFDPISMILGSAGGGGGGQMPPGISQILGSLFPQGQPPMGAAPPMGGPMPQGGPQGPPMGGPPMGGSPMPQQGGGMDFMQILQMMMGGQ